jgi:hypothetical protein
MSSQYGNRLVNIFANDPNAKGLGLEQVVPPAGYSPFLIPDWNDAGGLFDPGTAQFQAGQLHVVLNRTYAAWCDFMGMTVPWRSGKSQMTVEPRAGKDLNAYYDRDSVKFFFNTDPVSRQPVYACESSDVVAHECGHAILDAHHPDYWDSLLAETAAFHEAFGDISALLVTLGSEGVRSAVLTETNGELIKSNIASRMSEQMARGLLLSGHPESVVSVEAMRDLVNRFRYTDPDKLPARAPASKLSSESHSFSRIFSGAFYDLLVILYTQLRKASTLLTPDAALARARVDAGHLLGQALALAPKGDASFRTIAACMFTADAQRFSGANFDALRQAFVNRRVIKAKEADALKAANGSGHVHTSTLGGTTPVSLDKVEPYGVAEALTGEELPSGIRDTLSITADGFRLTSKHLRRGIGGVAHYTATRDLQLDDADLGVARGALVTLVDALALHLDSEGQVISSLFHNADEGHEHRIKSHMLRLVERGRVYAASPGERIDMAMLLERKQPYYIAYDNSGEKRIRRAFIA